MARRPIHVNKQQEILRLRGLGISERGVARTLRISRNSVRKYLTPAVPPEGPQSAVLSTFWVDHLDWPAIHQEYSQGISLKAIWEGYHDEKKVPAQYPNFWKQYQKRYPHQKVPTMVRTFEPGSRIEIDYCDGIDIHDLSTGEIIRTHLFVGVLCFSRHAYAEFSYTQNSQDFLSSHVRMFNYFGGTAQTLAPDNLKSAVSRVHPYDPVINPAYTRLAEHYNVAPTPARVRRPKDKAIVERTIQIFQRWFYARVRKRVFTSLIELNQALAEALEIFASKIHRTFGKSRGTMFQEERPHLQALPAQDFIVRTHKKSTLHHDCHLQFEKNYYSAPWELRGQELDVWALENQVEIFHKGECVAVHPRKRNRGKFITNPAHYPPQHKAYLEITPCFLREEAAKIGPSVLTLMDHLMKNKHPLRYLRRAQGIVALKKKYDNDKIDKACALALQYEQTHLSFIEKAILGNCFEAPTNEQTPKRGDNQFLRQQELFN